LRDRGVVVSVSRKEDCWDNAVAESFFATLKKELVHGQSWETRRDLERALFEYIDIYYNRQRLHSTNGYRTPTAVEEAFNKLAA
jgi:putative transposase